jgi:hypothetical protein
MKLNIFSYLFILSSLFCYSQNSEYSSLNIPDSLKQNANAVIRLRKLDITISSQKLMTIKSIRVTTVLNELGLRSLDLAESYDKNRKINKIEATVYNAFGKERPKKRKRTK